MDAVATDVEGCRAGTCSCADTSRSLPTVDRTVLQTQQHGRINDDGTHSWDPWINSVHIAPLMAAHIVNHYGDRLIGRVDGWLVHLMPTAAAPKAIWRIRQETNDA